MAFAKIVKLMSASAAAKLICSRQLGYYEHYIHFLQATVDRWLQVNRF